MYNPHKAARRAEKATGGHKPCLANILVSSSKCFVRPNTGLGVDTIADDNEHWFVTEDILQGGRQVPEGTRAMCQETKPDNGSVAKRLTHTKIIVEPVLAMTQGGLHPHRVAGLGEVIPPVREHLLPLMEGKFNAGEHLGMLVEDVPTDLRPKALKGELSKE